MADEHEDIIVLMGGLLLLYSLYAVGDRSEYTEYIHHYIDRQLPMSGGAGHCLQM